jgi:hypothetical protein
MNFHIKQALISVDQMVNATFLGGWADETVSARCWRCRGDLMWGIAEDVVNFIFGADHCFKSYLSEVKRRQSPAAER